LVLGKHGCFKENLSDAHQVAEALRLSLAEETALADLSACLLLLTLLLPLAQVFAFVLDCFGLFVMENPRRLWL